MRRRNFFQSFVAFVGAMLIAIAGVGTALLQGVASVLRGKGKEGTWIEVDKVSLIIPGKPAERTISFQTKDGWEEKIERQTVFILFKDGQPVVHSPSCPHLDCPVSLVQEENKLVCKCHMSYFDESGQVLSGPSPRGLDPLPTKVENDILYCRWVRYQSGGSEPVEV